MSCWVIVTAHLASSCWISTMSSAPLLLGIDLAALHDEAHVLRNGDVGQWISGHRDDIGELSLRQPAAICDVDQVDDDGGRLAQNGNRRQPPPARRDKLVGILAVGE